MTIWDQAGSNAPRPPPPHGTQHGCVTGGDTAGKVPKGYVPMMLVDEEDDEQGQRILVPVKML
jgi:hypothetical protein